MFTDVYEPSGGVVGSDTGIDITHAATYACKQIGRRGLLKPDSSASLPLVFRDTFPFLMKALLKPRVIVKSPLSNASDVRALRNAKIKFETDGHKGVDLVKLPIVTNRLWMPGRMNAFVSEIPCNPNAAPD